MDAIERIERTLLEAAERGRRDPEWMRRILEELRDPDELPILTAIERGVPVETIIAEAAERGLVYDYGAWRWVPMVEGEARAAHDGAATP